MEKTKIFALILAAALALTAALNIYQYTLNQNLTQQKANSDVQLEMKTQLAQVQGNIKGEMQTLDAALLDACNQLSKTGLTGTQARAVLTKLVANNSLIVNAATADAQDVLLAVEPSSYVGIEGKEMADQEQNVYMHQNMRPAMSNMIPLVEGFPGVVMVSPIFDGSGQFIGSLSIVIQPYNLIQKYAAPIIEDGQFSMWSMQLNGTLIFDPDPSQQSKNLLTDPVYTSYPDVQDFVRQAAEHQTGYGTYSYFDKDLSDSSGKVVKKEAYWTTIGIYNTQWRLIIVHSVKTN